MNLISLPETKNYRDVYVDTNILSAKRFRVRIYICVSKYIYFTLLYFTLCVNYIGNLVQM